MKKTLEELNPKHELIARAKTIFPPTYNPREAGYILEDGTLLDFSGKIEGGTPGTRTRDHREVRIVIYSGDSRITGDEALEFFEKQTNAIRFSHYSSGINMILSTYQTPTSRQLSAIRYVISQNLTTPLIFEAYDKHNNRVIDEFIDHPRPATLTKLMERFDKLKAKESAKMIPKDPHERHKEIKAQLEQITKEGGEAFRRKDTAKIRELHKLSKQLEDDQKKLAPTLLKHAWEVMKKEDQKPTKQTWQMTKDEFIEEYYKTDKAKRVIWRGRDYTKKTAQIAARKLGTEYSVEDSPYEKGRFIVVRYKAKLPLEEYKIKHGASLSNIHKQAINRAISEGKQIPHEVLRDYPELSLMKPKPWQPTLKGEISLLPQIIKKKEPRVKPKRKRPEIEPYQADLDKTYQSTLAIGALTLGAGLALAYMKRKT